MIQINVLASGSKGNCYHITDGQTPLLLEAGIYWKNIQRGLGFQVDIQGCLVTHEHKDHSKAVNEVAKAGIDVYMTEGTVKATGASGHRIRQIKAGNQFAIGTWAVLPFKTEHDCAEPVGYLLGNGKDKLLFATDTFYLRYCFNGLNYILIECNYSEDILKANVEAGIVPVDLKNRIIKSHFGLANVKEFLKANDLSRVQEIYLIHLSDGNSDADRFKREIQGLTGKPVYVAGA